MKSNFDKNTETYLKLDCCGIKVGEWYNYCPKCGKKIDIEKCEKGYIMAGTGLYDLFDYATWICSCGRGYERYSYEYCPICGNNRLANKNDKKAISEK